MKFLSGFLFLFLVFTLSTNAQTINTGDASTKSEVRTESQGNADVYTKIELRANGEQKKLETNEPGTHELEVGSSASAEVDIKGSTLSGDEEDEDEDFARPQAVIQKILHAISEIFKRILSLFT